MFCPNCKAEYKEGYTKCSDCGIVLVPELPIEELIEPEHDGSFVTILETNDFMDIPLIKAALDAGNVQYFIQGEEMNVIYPFAQSAILMVAAEDTEKAVELLQDVKLNYIRMIFDPNQ